MLLIVGRYFTCIHLSSVYQVPAYLASLGQSRHQEWLAQNDNHGHDDNDRNQSNEHDGIVMARRPSLDGVSSLALPQRAAAPAFADEHMAVASMTAAKSLQGAPEASSRLNPADLLLDVASSSVCQQLAEAVRNGTFVHGGVGDGGGQAVAGVGSGGGADLTGSNRVGAFPRLDVTSSTFVPAITSDHDENGTGFGEGAASIDDEEASGHGSALVGLQPYASSSSGDGGGMYEKCMQWSVAAGGFASSSSSSSSTSYRGGGRRFQKALPFPPRHRASILLQIQALSSRLVLTAARHPMLLLLQYAGCLFLAVCVGFIFFDLEADL